MKNYALQVNGSFTKDFMKIKAAKAAFCKEVEKRINRPGDEVLLVSIIRDYTPICEFYNNEY